MQKHGVTLTVFRSTFTVVIFIESLLTVVHSLQSTTESHLGTILPWFAAIQALAAVLLLFRRTLLGGSSILLVTFIADIVIHGPADRLHIFVYAAAVVLLMFGGDRDSTRRGR